MTRERAVTTEYIAEVAMRWDTVVAWAFRKALGLEKRPKGGRSLKGASSGVYDGVAELMGQRYGVRL